MTADAPQATVLITTKDRRDQLRDALASVLAQEGATIEVLVLDDGSQDGSAEMVRQAHPAARVHREERSLGVVAARNLGHRLARGAVVFTLDDDAVFRSPGTVAQTLEDLAGPRIGAVAIPHVDVTAGGAFVRRSVPDRRGIWICPTFSAGACAIRRDVFAELGGYQPDFGRQGEEADFALRMIDAGWWCRLGRAEPIHHHEDTGGSARHDYGRRNEILHLWRNLPAPLLMPYLIIYMVRGLLYGLRIGELPAMLRGIGRGFAAIATSRFRRSPVSWRAVVVDRRLRDAQALPLEELGAPTATHARRAALTAPRRWLRRDGGAA
jgi:glycosyltransferase involved in cell wall biosynthesis